MVYSGPWGETHEGFKLTQNRHVVEAIREGSQTTDAELPIEK